MERYGVGQPMRRREDLRLLTGAGRFIDDVVVPELAHACITRSPHAHARVRAIDTGAARAAPGVIAVLTGADWAADGLGGIPTRTGAKNSDGSPVPVPERPGLVAERARFVGDAIAMVVAETRDQARDALDLLAIDYEPLPALTSARAALAPGAPPVWDHLPGNVCVEYEVGDRAAVDAAVAGAAHVVSLEIDNQRVTAVPIEPRGVLAYRDEPGARTTIVSATQNVHANRNQLAESVFRVAPSELRMVAYDVGGGFGAKNALYPEHALVAWAARRTGRPVKWVAERGECFLADTHGRDQQAHVDLALDAEGRFLALAVDTAGPIGPYVMSVGPFTPTGGTARTQGGPYRIPALHFRGRAVFTHTAPTDPYRGAGRPEASYQIERAVDAAAAALGMDPIELRRRNLLARDELPWVTGAGTEIECGDFPTVLARALALADADGFAARADDARARGRRRGLGVCCYLECTGGGPKEHAAVSFGPDGRVRLAVGSHSTGMSHETVFPTLLAERLGIDVARIDFVQADTDATPIGGGHGGSRSLEMGGAALVGAAERVIEAGRAIASDLLEAAAGDVEFERGEYRVVGTDRVVGIDAVAAAALDPERGPGTGLAASDTHERVGISYPNGCHVAEVEVDPDTGVVDLVRYSVVDDFGTIVNRHTTAGQVAGGTVQGIGQALLEQVVYDADSGQLLTGSLMDYALPRADDVPWIDVEFFEDAPSAHNPLGVKGSGEAGCCGALPAVVGAVARALAEYGVGRIDMPLTPERVWRAIRAGRGVPAAGAAARS